MINEQKSEQIIEIKNGTILSPTGYSSAGIHAGLRQTKKDLGLIYSEVPAVCAAVYTLNKFQAAPLTVTKESIAQEGKIQAVIVNSANANACTGQQGITDALTMQKETANKLQIDQHLVAVASTGVIGETLPIEKISKGIKAIELGTNEADAEAFQTAILTTDTVMKRSCYQTEINGKKVTIGGAAKGSGMINPNMATMLTFITTDAAVEQTALNDLLKQITEETFNQITVDGDTSTNDMVIVLANGTAENTELSEDHPEWPKFKQSLYKVCKSLAKQIARDGEGATKLVEVQVTGATTVKDAQVIAKQIVGSNLVKTAIYGEDANWGRIIGAIGQADAQLDPEKVDIKIGPIAILEKSEPLLFSNDEATEYLKNDYIKIYVNLNNGTAKGCAWGCDLSYDYIKINASYRT